MDGWMDGWMILSIHPSICDMLLYYYYASWIDRSIFWLAFRDCRLSVFQSSTFSGVFLSVSCRRVRARTNIHRLIGRPRLGSILGIVRQGGPRVHTRTYIL
jgi:hypothetical protein